MGDIIKFSKEEHREPPCQMCGEKGPGALTLNFKYASNIDLRQYQFLTCRICLMKALNELFEYSEQLIWQLEEDPESRDK